VFVAHKNSLAGAAHTMELVVLLKPLKTGNNRRILLWLGLLSSECVVGQWVEANGLWLLCGEVLGNDGSRLLLG
jgi:hypothetical protein